MILEQKTSLAEVMVVPVRASENLPTKDGTSLETLWHRPEINLLRALEPAPETESTRLQEEITRPRNG